MRLHTLAILFVGLSGTAHASQNLLQNGNFGIAPVPSWLPVPVTLSYTHFMSDGQPAAPSVDITTSGTGSSGQGFYQCVATTPGTVYRATAYVKRTSGAPTTTISSIGLAALFYTGANCTGTPLGLANATVSPNTLVMNVWTKVDSGAVTAPAGTVNALVGLGANAANTEVYTFRGDSAYFGLADVIFSAGFEND